MLNIKVKLSETLEKIGKSQQSDCLWLLYKMSQFLGTGNKCWPCNKTLQKLTGWGNKKLLATRNNLYQLGILSREFKREGSKNKNIYTIDPSFISKFNGANPIQPMSNGHTSIQPMSIQPMSNGHTYYLLPMSNGHTYLKVPVSIQPMLTQPMSNGHTEVLDIKEVFNKYQVLIKKEEEQSSPSDLSKQIVSLKNKIQQLEEQNKKLAERLTKQPVNQNTEGAKDSKSKKPLPYLEEYKTLVEYINYTCKRQLPIYEDPKRIAEDQKYKKIIARLRKGATVDEMQRIVKLKSKKWINSDRFKQYLHPSTLFGEKYTKYLDELSSQVSDTPIKDSYDKVKEFIDANEISPDDLYDMSNNLGKYKTQP